MTATAPVAAPARPLPKPRTTFGRVLRAWRIDNDYTQTELAQQLGVRKGTISDWELGNNHPSGALLDKMLKLVQADAATVDAVCREFALR